MFRAYRVKFTRDIRFLSILVSGPITSPLGSASTVLFSLSIQTFCMYACSIWKLFAVFQLSIMAKCRFGVWHRYICHDPIVLFPFSCRHWTSISSTLWKLSRPYLRIRVYIYYTNFLSILSIWHCFPSRIYYVTRVFNNVQNIRNTAKNDRRTSCTFPLATSKTLVHVVHATFGTRQ